MDGTRRRFLALALGCAALWTLGRAQAADTAPAAPAGDVAHLTLGVEGMH